MSRDEQEDYWIIKVITDPEERQRDALAMLQMIINFLQTPTWEESKRFVESHPELLRRPEVDVNLMLLATQQAQIRDAIDEHRRLLARCRKEGIDAAYAPYLGR